MKISLRRLFSRKASSAEDSLHDEIQSYLQHEIDARVEKGMAPDAARRTVRVDWGGADRIAQEVRDAKSGAWLDGLKQDAGFAFRSLRKARGFSLAVIASLSLGMATMVAGFAFIGPLLFPQYAGVADPDRMLALIIGGRCPGGNCWAPSSIKDHDAMRDSLTTLEGLASYLTLDVTAGLHEPRSLSADFVTQDYFDVLGTHAAIGRLYSNNDVDFANEGAIISHAIWTQEFGRDPSVLGQSIRIANRSVRIIGVAPEGFVGFVSDPRDLWLPLPLATAVSSSKLRIDQTTLRSVGRMAKGINLPQVRAQAETVIAQISESQGKGTAPGRIWLNDANLRFERFKTVAFVGTVMAIPILVLFISCVNAANLMLSRATERSREISIRLAIGASRIRIVREVLIESLLLALTASAVGMVLAAWAVRFASSQTRIPFAIDSRVLLFTIVTAFVCALEFGLAPASSMASQQPNQALGTAYASGGSPNRNRTHHRLVTIQIALSLGLLVTGQEIVRNFQKRSALPNGATGKLMMASFDLNQLRMTSAESSRFYDDLLDRVSKLPGVQAATLGPSLANWNKVPLDSMLQSWPTDEKNNRGAWGGPIDPNFLKTVGLRTLQGREFNQEDYSARQPETVIVSSSYAKNVLNNDALGRVIRVTNYGGTYATSVPVRVVGVVESVKERADNPDGNGAIYLPSPITEMPQAQLLYVFPRASTRGLAASIRKVVRLADSRVPILDIGTIDEIQDRRHPENWLGSIVQFLGYLALLLATAGLYAVVSYAVTTRFREISIRMTLGAQPSRILAMILRQSLAPAAVGAIGGAFMTLVIISFIQFWINQAIDINGAAFARSTIELMVAMLLASIIPALRAARVAPMTTLKEQ